MKKDKRNKLTIVMQAMLITVAFHCLLLFGFRLPPEEAPPENYGYRRIALLPMTGKGEFDPVKLRTWLDYNDPTLIAKPNFHYGYGSLNVRTGLRPHIVAEEPQHPWRQPAFTLAGGSLGGRNVDALQVAAALPDWPTAPLPAYGKPSVAAVVAADRSVVVRDQYGNEFARGSFDCSGGELAAEFRRLKPLRNTVLQLNGEVVGRLARFSVRASCGNRVLDELAVRVLLSSGEGLAVGRELTLTITWQEPEAAK